MLDFAIIFAATTAAITTVAFVALFALHAARRAAIGGHRDVNAMCGSGGHAASAMLAQAGSDATVHLRGDADAYDAATREISLCASTYNGTDAASVALACHEAGHALQRAESGIEGGASGAVRTASLACWALWVVALVASLVFANGMCAVATCALWCVAVLCGLAPCRLEADASRRALAFMRSVSVPAVALAVGRRVLRISLCEHLAAAFAPVQILR